MGRREDLERWPDDGSIPSHVQAFIDWYVTPEFARAEAGLPPTINAWALANGFTPGSCYDWKRRPVVRRAIEKMYADQNVDPDRVQEIVDAMFREAKNGDTKAATLYLQYIERLAPKRIVIEDRGIESLSDAEFQREVEKILATS